MPTLTAPRPHFEAYTSRGRLYIADSDGVISNVDFLDVGDLIASGCSQRAAPPNITVTTPVITVTKGAEAVTPRMPQPQSQSQSQPKPNQMNPSGAAGGSSGKTVEAQKMASSALAPSAPASVA